MIQHKNFRTMHFLGKLPSESPLIPAVASARALSFANSFNYFGLHHPSSDGVPNPKIAKGASIRHTSSSSSSSCSGKSVIPHHAVVNLFGKNGSTKFGVLGTIIDENGTIVTCGEVIKWYGEKVKVTLRDGRSFEGAVVSADIYSDISIVKINSKTDLPTAKLGSSSKLHPGDVVLTRRAEGVIQSVDLGGGDMDFLHGMKRHWLTSIPHSRDAFGEPVLNVDGELIGVSTIRSFGSTITNIVLPIDPVIKMIEHFRVSRRIVRPWLGLKMIDLDDMIVAYLKETDDQFPDVSRGVLVPWVVLLGSPAYCAGLRKGDVIVEFEGRTVESLMEVIEIMGEKRGKPLEVVVKRRKNITANFTVIPDEKQLIK